VRWAYGNLPTAGQPDAQGHGDPEDRQRPDRPGPRRRHARGPRRLKSLGMSSAPGLHACVILPLGPSLGSRGSKVLASFSFGLEGRPNCARRQPAVRFRRPSVESRRAVAGAGGSSTVSEANGRSIARRRSGMSRWVRAVGGAREGDTPVIVSLLVSASYDTLFHRWLMRASLGLRLPHPAGVLGK
jgi:hypothetical protein